VARTVQKQLTYPLMAFAATLLLHFALGMAWRWASLVAFVGWPIAGTLITLDGDDDIKDSASLFSDIQSWGQLIAGCGVAAFIAAADVWPSGAVPLLGTTGLVASIVGGTLLWRSRRER